MDICHHSRGALPGFTVSGVVLSMIAFEYTGQEEFALVSGGLATALVGMLIPSVRPSRLLFVAIALLLVIWTMATQDDWQGALAQAIRLGAMVISLFTALTALRNAAMSSPAIIECGRFLASQKPGLRYLALTIGGHFFSLILLYGSISLLGSLAVESNSREPDLAVRTQRTRRMMIAIQRGFSSTLCWSPLGFSMIITVSIVPGASWATAALPCIISAILMLAIGWWLDATYKPQIVATAGPTARPRWFAELRPLVVLLCVVVLGVGSLHLFTGVEMIGAVMLFVPQIAIGWIAMQSPPEGVGRIRNTCARISNFITRELPAYSNEILLLFMAGFIGSIGGFLLAPIAAAHGPDLSALPPWLIVIGMVWLIPLTGQLGMNPILAVSLMVPILPSPSTIGIPPTALVAAITGGWALSGTTSPYTASVLLAAKLGGVSTGRAGLGWNGVYTALTGAALAAWAVALIYIL